MTDTRSVAGGNYKLKARPAKECFVNLDLCACTCVSKQNLGLRTKVLRSDGGGGDGVRRWWCCLRSGTSLASSWSEEAPSVTKKNKAKHHARARRSGAGGTVRAITGKRPTGSQSQHGTSARAM